MPGAAYESIASATVTNTTTTSVTFNNIPSTFKDLQIRGTVRVATTAGITGWYALGTVVNNNIAGSGNTYAWQYGGVSNGVAIGNYESYTNPDRFYWPYAPTDKTNASEFASFVMDINDYSTTTFKKSVRCVQASGSQTGGDAFYIYVAGIWNSTNVISRLDFTTIGGTNYIMQNSTFALYGIRNS